MAGRRVVIEWLASPRGVHASCPDCASLSIVRRSLPQLKAEMKAHGKVFRHGWAQIAWKPGA